MGMAGKEESLQSFRSPSLDLFARVRTCHGWLFREMLLGNVKLWEAMHQVTCSGCSFVVSLLGQLVFRGSIMPGCARHIQSAKYREGLYLLLVLCFRSAPLLQPHAQT